MRIQLWSYNYDPEPTGIAPISAALAGAMVDRGHDLEVIAAHPHYPAPAWGRRLRPYREVRDGIPVTRLPLWPGRGSTSARVRQELTFTASLSLMAPAFPTPDVIVAVSPSFPALAPAIAAARIRSVPWVLWLQDILPDGAIATGLLDDSRLLRAARRFEAFAYRSAAKIVVISDSFVEALVAKGVPRNHLVRIFNPASHPIKLDSVGERPVDPGLVVTMGNIGRTQNLVHVVRAFESSERLARLGARFVIAGDGVAAPEVRAAVRTDRVQLTGVLSRPQLERYLLDAAVAVVSQQYEGFDFNVPSKLMNFMGYGIPTLAAVRPDSEVARLIRESGGGWVTQASDPGTFSSQLVSALESPRARNERGRHALRFARENFGPPAIAAQFEAVLKTVLASHRPTPWERRPRGAVRSG